MKRACVIGWPIAHSRSPLIHGYWLKRYGIDGTYTKEAVEPDGVDAFISSLASQGFSGCNVTVPHKERAFAAAAIKDDAAIAVGAANTLWFDDGKLVCTNTDTYGFMTNLSHGVPSWQSAKGAIVVLGAGGSARAVVHGFLESGRTDVRIFNRSLDRAEALARHFGKKVSAWPWEARNDHVSAAAVIVNTTTLGMNGAGDTEIGRASCRERV